MPESNSIFLRVPIEQSPDGAMAAGILKMAWIEFRGYHKLCGPTFCFVASFCF